MSQSIASTPRSVCEEQQRAGPVVLTEYADYP
jgi:hypothetical protein